MFPINASFHAYAFRKDDSDTMKTYINSLSLDIIRRGILCWNRNFESKQFSARACLRYSSLKNLRGRIFYQSQSLIWKLLEKWIFCNNSRINGHNRSIFRHILDIYNIYILREFAFSHDFRLFWPKRNNPPPQSKGCQKFCVGVIFDD